MYRIYPTLLDSFTRYKGSVNYKEAAEAKQELLNKINRVPEPMPPIVNQGKWFKEAIDFLCNQVEEGNDLTAVGGFDGVFRWRSPSGLQGEIGIDVAEYFVKKLAHSVKEYFTQGQIVVDNHIVELYGYVDNIREDVIWDCKYVQKYDLAKYFSSMQRLIYPYCIEQQGGQVSQFEFLATNGEEIFSEVYNWKPERDVPMLKNTLSDFIKFINENRSFITDRKLVLED